MAFVKLDTKILNSTTWLDADACKVFITALLMAEPFEAKEPLHAIQVRSTEPDGFVVPAGWYGFVPAAGPGIAHRALIEQERALDALERLAGPDPGSRTPDHEGRRMVRVPGGYLILNYMAHRDKDHGAAERQKRLRERRRGMEAAAPEGNRVTFGPDWDAVVAFYGGNCAYCQEAPWVDMDHVVATSRGGKHEIGNVVPACKSCNSRKRAETWEPCRRHPFMSRVTVTPVTHADADADADTERSKAKAGAAAAKRGRRLPDDWAPGDDLLEFAVECGFNRERFELELAKFRDYWRAMPGAKGCKLDWPATFRNWIRNAQSRHQGVPRETDRPKPSLVDRAAQRIAAQLETHQARERHDAGEAVDPRDGSVGAQMDEQPGRDTAHR